MQQDTLWFCAALSVVLIVTSFVDGQEVILLSDTDISPLGQGVLTSGEAFGYELEDRAERQKRKILEPVVEASFGIKSALLNIIFGKVNQLIDYKTRLVDQLDKKNIELNKAYGLYGQRPCDNRPTTVKPVGSTTTEDIADIDRNRVSLDLPSELFGKSFELATKISQIIGDLILNTAARTQTLVEAVKPVFGKVLGIKTRTKPPTSSSSSSSSSSATSSSYSSSSARSSRSNVKKTVALDSDQSVSKNLVDIES